MLNKVFSEVYNDIRIDDFYELLFQFCLKACKLNAMSKMRMCFFLSSPSRKASGCGTGFPAVVAEGNGVRPGSIIMISYVYNGINLSGLLRRNIVGPIFFFIRHTGRK